MFDYVQYLPLRVIGEHTLIANQSDADDFKERLSQAVAKLEHLACGQSNSSASQSMAQWTRFDPVVEVAVMISAI